MTTPANRIATSIYPVKSEAFSNSDTSSGYESGGRTANTNPGRKYLIAFSVDSMTSLIASTIAVLRE
jgi:hypothetical protein